LACSSQKCGDPLIVGDVLYTTCADKRLYAIDLITGKQRWRLDKGYMLPMPAFADGVMYLLGMDGFLTAMK
jgi:glucose dehydrogenase